MKKFLSLVLALVIALTIFNGVTVSASGIYNVYDPQSLNVYLAIPGADIILWGDVSFSDATSVQCNSIDLNGYHLQFNSTMTIGEEIESFTLLDSTYNAGSDDNSGKFTALKGVDISTSTFIIENGVIDVSNGIYGTGDLKITDGDITVNGTVGKDGAKGIDGISAGGFSTHGGAGIVGADGTNGGDGINVSSLSVSGGKLTVSGGKGGDGGSGGNGGAGWSNAIKDGAGNGGTGGNGGNGGKSGKGIVATEMVIITNADIIVAGGKGGTGGDGGDGGTGGRNSGGYNGGIGGNGGNGGNNNCGGEGIVTPSLTVNGGNITITGGDNGDVSSGGNGGAGGRSSSSYGANGLDGTTGKILGYGGSAINANTIINDGTVKATGGNNAAAIGGSGYSGETDGSDVVITGGTVIVKAGENAFDIGSGYDGTRYGTAGTLEVNGGTLEFTTYGKATNVSNPVFKNCTIMGEGAYQHEGTYNENGYFPVEVTDIETITEGKETYLKAHIKVLRSSGIKTPALKGTVLFMSNGRDIGTATIENAETTDGVVIAYAMTEWKEVSNGTYVVMVEYVPGKNDRYASTGMLTETIEITSGTDEPSEQTFDISGNVKSFGNGNITIELLKDDAVVGTKNVTTSYAFEDIAEGKYTVRVSASKHATREYKITVGEANVTQNVEIWLYGDVTKDGVVNNADVIQINRRNTNLASVFDQTADTDYRFKVANITAITGTDTTLNNADVMQINRKNTNMSSVFDRIA